MFERASRKVRQRMADRFLHECIVAPALARQAYGAAEAAVAEAASSPAAPEPAPAAPTLRQRVRQGQSLPMLFFPFR